MKRLEFIVNIEAPVAKVYDYMLGITDKSTYEQWTAMFNPTSTYDGKWEKGSKILFVGVDENGVRGGMVSELVDLVPLQFVSIRHYGIVKGTEEITAGPEVDSWANGLENYTFEVQGDATKVTTHLDTLEDYEAYLNESYPKALAKLKEMCEE